VQYKILFSCFHEVSLCADHLSDTITTILISLLRNNIVKIFYLQILNSVLDLHVIANAKTLQQAELKNTFI